MDRAIPNTAPIGGDRCLEPIVVDVPLLIVDRGDECYWFGETMDKSAAERTAFAMMQSLDVEAFQVNVKIVLPAASDVLAVTAELDSLHSVPVRAILRAND